MLCGTRFIALTKFFIAFALVGTLQMHLACCPMNTLVTHPGCDLEPEDKGRDKVLATDGCQAAICGSNSPYVNAFPFNGLNTSGCVNADGYALHEAKIPGTQVSRVPIDVSATACKHTGEQLYLDFRSAGIQPGNNQSKPSQGYPPLSGWQLVATNSQGDPVCRGNLLAGAKFKVISRDSTTTLLISHVGVTSIKYLDAKSLDDFNTCNKQCTATLTDQDDCKANCKRPPALPEGRYVYLISNDRNPSRSLCTRYARHHQKHPADIDPPIDQIAHVSASGGNPLWDIDHDELGAYAVIIPGTIYDDAGRRILLKGGAEVDSNLKTWFNVACAGDGLGQSDLGGVVESTSDASYSEDKVRQAAIHMFTAKYGGGASGTVGGTPIAWKTDVRASLDLESYHKDAKSLPKEAEWDQQGATCIYRSRLWMSNRTIPLPPDIQKFRKLTPDKIREIHVEQNFVDQLCDEDTSASCQDSDSLSGVKVLTSYVRDHVPHCRSESHPPDPIPHCVSEPQSSGLDPEATPRACYREMKKASLSSAIVRP